VDAKHQPLHPLYGFSDFELGEDFGASSLSAGISSDFTLLGSIRKLEDLARLIYIPTNDAKSRLGRAF
jgi:hypothetical protein